MMKKYIQVIAYECEGLLAFTHKRIEAESRRDAYEMEHDFPDGFRNWYIIPVHEKDEEPW